ncbi:glycosyltransferase [Larkinella bovis]|uniref:Glycosyltransferase n=1 Tax=Larkinella bovis TaxID=683041 RepID=A0ABW0IHR5_9BACT
MLNKILNIALVSPNKNAYSETFIEAHKNLNGNIFYYYGGHFPNYLENKGNIALKRNIIFFLFKKIKKKILRIPLSIAEQDLVYSLKKNKIDVVLAEYGQTGASLVNTCSYAKIPLVVIFHGYDSSIRSVLESNKEGYENLFNYAKKIIAVSDVMREKLIEIGCPINKITKSIYGPNDLFLQIKPTFSEPLSFVAIGRLVNKKAPYYTILAFRKVVNKYPSAKLYFAGSGELFETIKNLITYFNLEKNILLLGVISPVEYADILSRVAGFVQHSIIAMNGDMEGTPVAILEASAAGIPVIATRHGGIPEVIIDGISGFLVDEHDVEGMAQALISLIENPDMARVMGLAGKENIKLNFSMSTHLNKLYDALIS